MFKKITQSGRVVITFLERKGHDALLATQTASTSLSEILLKACHFKW